MKYLFLLALALPIWAQFPPSSGGNAKTIMGKPICASVMAATDGQILTWSTASNCFTVSSAGAGAGDVLGAASVQSGRVPYGSGTASTITSSSKFAYNDTTGMGLIPPLSLGQNGTAAGKINFLGSTSGTLPFEVNADGTILTITGNVILTGYLQAGASGANTLTAIAAPSSPAAGLGEFYMDSTSLNFALKNTNGIVNHGVRTKAAVSNQLVSAIDDDGTVTTRAIAAADLPGTLTSGTAITNAALTTPSIGAATGTSLVATGIVSGLAPVTYLQDADPCPTGTHCAVGATYNMGYIINGATTEASATFFDLPAAVAGMQYCFENGAGNSGATTGVMKVIAASGDYITLLGVKSGTSGSTATSGGAAGDAACFISVKADEWVMKVSGGTWSTN